MSNLSITPRYAVLTIQREAGPALVLQALARPQIVLAAVGVQGPPGDGERLIYTQAAPASVWTINHNFGHRVAVTAYSVGGAEIEGEVVSTSLNQTQILFVIPTAGFAVVT